MKHLVFLSPLVLILAFACNRTDSGPTWSEEFESETLDSSTWSKIPRGKSEWNKHMSDLDSLYAIEDGKLVLRAIVNPGVPGDSTDLLTGGVWTIDKKSFGYGRLEICAKLEGTGGGWPAIWMMPASNDSDPDDPFWNDYAPYKNYGELDICERLNFDPFAYQTIHTSYNLTEAGDPYQEKGSTGAINPDDFNVFAVEHYHDSIKFFINDVNTLTYRKMSQAPDGTEIPLKAQWPFDREFYLYIDMQVGAPWPGEAVLEDLPSSMIIDWVRFYGFDE